MSKHFYTCTEDIKFESAKILAHPSHVDFASKKPSVSINKTAISSPSKFFSRKGLDHIFIPKVSFFDPTKKC